MSGFKTVFPQGSYHRVSAIAAGLSVMLLASCGQEEAPHLANCQTITKNLVGSVEWSDSNVKESPNNLTVNASYKSGSGESGKVSCIYPRQRQDGGEGPIATAPETVLLNGERVPTRELFSAGTKASKEQLTAVAKETAKQTEQVAREASDKAGEIAADASKKAAVLAEQASEKAGQLAGKAEELAGQAGIAASDLGEQAKGIALDASKKLQKALETK